MIELSKAGDLHLVRMNNGPNMICPEWQSGMIEILDTVEADCEGPAALVLTGEGKSFSNGLNLEVLMSLDVEGVAAFGTTMGEIFRRLLLLPVPTVAALNGHAFAAGAFLALACDYRLMREDRGWFCISEVDVGVPIDIPMMKLVSAKLPPATVRDAVLTGKRYTADEAVGASIADGKASEEALLDQAKALAASLADKERNIFRTLKRNMYGAVGDGLVGEV